MLRCQNRVLAAVDGSGLNGEQADALTFLIHADALRIASVTSPGDSRILSSP